MEDKVTAFLESINITTNKPFLYKQALTHSSYSYEKKKPDQSNERLEFLGDAVLELIISEYLYQTFLNFRKEN